MNEGYNSTYPGTLGLAGAAGQMMIGKQLVSPTLRENIDQRIMQLEDNIKRLEKVRGLLAEGWMLDIPIEDLRFAMNY
jgi:hypothetical protein